MKNRTLRRAAETLVLLLIAVFSVQAYLSWKNSDYPFPDEKGLRDAAGVYDVKDFVWKGDTLAYSLADMVMATPPYRPAQAKPTPAPSL